MNKKIKGLNLVLAFVLSFFGQPVFGQSDAQQKQAKAPKGFLSPVPNNRAVKGCYPAEVIAVMQGAPPPEGIEVIIKNFHMKTIKAVKIGWYIAEDEDRTLASRILKTSCDAPLLSDDQIILSGETSLIEVGPLHLQQTAAIGKEPLKFAYETADRKVLTEAPLLAMEDIKGLTKDEDMKTFEKIYAIIMGVSEILFTDGTVWKVGGVPPPLSLDPQ